MLEKLFEAIDEKVLTPELKSELEKSFNEAIDLKATELSEAAISEAKIKLDEEAAKAREELEAKIAEDNKELLESVDTYLERVVEGFITESKEALTESIKAEKSDMIIEAMEAMLVATGVEISKIDEAKIDDSIEAKLEEKTAKYDELMEENIAKDKEINELIQAGIISEMKEGLSLVEAEKFEKLAKIVEFSRDSKYAEKLDTIKESVKGSKEDKVDESLNEDKKDDVPSWKRFV